MVVERPRLMTATAFWEWLEGQREAGNHSLYELVDGEIVALAHPRKINSIIAAFIVRMLGNFVDDNTIAAYVLGADGGYTLGEQDARVPDASVIYRDRIPDLDNRTDVIAPDLAVEVISPSESPHHVSEKTALYLRTGTKIVWNVYPDSQSVDVWTQIDLKTMQVRRLTKEDTLDGGDVLPGFSLPIRQLFER